MTVRLFPWPLLPTQGTVLKAHNSTSSRSPRCPWISWDKSRSRLTGLLHETWRLKSKLSMPLEKEASSRSRKERKFSCNPSQSCSRWVPNWNASLSCFRHNIPMLHTLQPRQLAHKGTLRPTGASDGDVSHLLVTIITQLAYRSRNMSTPGHPSPHQGSCHSAL